MRRPGELAVVCIIGGSIMASSLAGDGVPHGLHVEIEVPRAPVLPRVAAQVGSLSWASVTTYAYPG